MAFWVAFIDKYTGFLEKFYSKARHLTGKNEKIINPGIPHPDLYLLIFYLLILGIFVFSFLLLHLQESFCIQ